MKEMVYLMIDRRMDLTNLENYLHQIYLIVYNLVKID